MTRSRSKQTQKEITNNLKASQREAFSASLEKIVGVDRERPTIGTLAEKTVHAVLKNYYDPEEDHQEIPIDRYVADVFTGKEIFEIQTRQMFRMKGKLDAFLPQYPVSIVYPVPVVKTLYWLDPDTGEVSGGRKSPKKGMVYDVFAELDGIREYLDRPNLSIRVVLMNMTEYKLLCGRSKDRKHFGAERYDRIPTELVDEVVLTCPEDYMQFVPDTLPERFTAAEFGKEAHISKELAGYALRVLRQLGIVEKVGKVGNAFLYSCTY
jgi:hypothetical protein